MKFFLFEDSHALNFEPISLTRPVFDIRYGEYNLLNRTEKFLPRKLFEPQLYPRSEVFPVFDKFFGKVETRNTSEVFIPHRRL